MRIGIDIDGVLTDEHNYVLDNGTKYFSDNNIPIRCYASEIIRKLKTEGNQIFIITSRSFTTYENENKVRMQRLVKEWLKTNSVLYDEIIFTMKKADVCKEKKIDLMIEDKPENMEDKPENIEDISKEIPVIVYDCSYN